MDELLLDGNLLCAIITFGCIDTINFELLQTVYILIIYGLISYQ